ncbi:DUF3667 domain-containing protein [Hymenobacter sp. B81]|uniref:DUF3667 domain-containing protein n=1 Tax=Hymenobacter sp. B81 TaxID=3344878 RepID=UPI0037DDA6A8
MAHDSARLPTCPNCGYDFRANPGPDAYCPSCGQQNHPLDLSVAHFVEETLEGLFHFDGKFFRTLRLLFLPGRLTRHFNEGRRMPFVPPIRLYVFTSFVLFLLLSLSAGHDRRRFAEAIVSDGTAAGAVADSIRLNTGAEAQVADSLARRLAQRRRVELNSAVDGFTWSEADVASYEQDPTDARIDSLLRSKGTTPSSTTRFMFRQYARFQAATVDEVRQRFLKSLSVTLFFLMPVFALLLKLLYVRQRRYYLSHLIFSLHLHSFFLILFMLNMIWTWLLHNDWFVQVLIWGPPIYLLLALRHVYGQSWRKSAAKSLLLIVSYALVLFVGLISMVLLGAALL